MMRLSKYSLTTSHLMREEFDDCVTLPANDIPVLSFPVLNDLPCPSFPENDTVHDVDVPRRNHAVIEHLCHLIDITLFESNSKPFFPACSRMWWLLLVFE